jgi:hypothetical protein
MFDSHIPCRARAIPRPCRFESGFQGHGTEHHGHGMAWHGICELASAAQTRHVGDLSLSASSDHHAEFHEGCYQKHTNPINCRTSCSDISGYHADFHEGHGNVGEWQGRGMAHQVNGMGTALAGHDTCELAFQVPSVT